MTLTALAWGLWSSCALLPRWVASLALEQGVEALAVWIKEDPFRLLAGALWGGVWNAGVVTLLILWTAATWPCSTTFVGLGHCLGYCGAVTWLHSTELKPYHPPHPSWLDRLLRHEHLQLAPHTTAALGTGLGLWLSLPRPCAATPWGWSLALPLGLALGLANAWVTPRPSPLPTAEDRT